MNGELTVEEQNLIKDILKEIGNDTHLTERIIHAVRMKEEKFEHFADSIFNKLQNGRVTVETNENAPEQERERDATNLEVVTEYMEFGSPLKQGFVIEALTRYAKQVTSNPDAVRKGMKDAFINAEAWIQCAEEWMKIARAKYGEKK